MLTLSIGLREWHGERAKAIAFAEWPPSRASMETDRLLSYVDVAQGGR